MPDIFQFYAKLLTWFKNKPKDNNENINSTNKDPTNTDYTASVFLGLLSNDNDSVDIKCLLPDVREKSIQQIEHIAEKYAQLLLLLNTEGFNKNILSILNAYKANHKDNYKAIMLIDNVISFWDMLYQAENKKYYQKLRSNQPLIRPSEAFKIK